MWGFFFNHQAILRHQLSALQFNSIPTLSTGDSIIPHKLRAQSHKTATTHPPSWNANSKSRLSSVLLTHCLWIGGSNDPFLGFDSTVAHSTQINTFSSVAQSYPTLCDPMNRSTPGLPVHHQIPEFTQTHVHRVGDAIQPSHPLSSSSPLGPKPSQHQSIFQGVNSSHEVAKVLEFQL